MDNLSKKQRSENMKRIRAKDTEPEKIVRAYLFKRGLRYRVTDKRYPGKPDIVLPRYKAVIFVHGCFWHQHPGCRRAARPKSNTDYWEPKLKRNVERDRENIQKLEQMGWRTFVVWECELNKENRETTLDRLYKEITSRL